jgi:phospholipase C
VDEWPDRCTDPDTLPGSVFPNCPDKLFQFHHQPLNYFASFAPGTRARARHLRDEDEFESLAAASGRHCRLKPVSFVKPIGAENEHPGYASEHTGSDHLADLLQAMQGSDCADDATSVMATIEHRFGLRPVSSRDAAVQDLSTVFAERRRHHDD